MSTEEAYLAAVGATRSKSVRETPANDDELAWQARWFSGACGREFIADSGQPVEIVDFGQWNSEAGPDFIRATVRIGGNERRGAIELDLHASDWERHGHAENESFADTLLHVVVHAYPKPRFPRTMENRSIPQVCLEGAAGAPPEWKAVCPARPGRCTAPLRAMSSEKLESLLKVAARRRLTRKSDSLAAMMAARGEENALYEALAVALGYKANKLPFQILAQKVPRRTAGTPRGEALLYGLGGFLEQPDPPSADSRKELGELWKSWWKQRAAFENALLPPRAWKLSGIRPANAPVRRLAALVAIARDWKTIARAIESANLAEIEASLRNLVHPFWSFHTSWTSPRRKLPLALVGRERALAIFANIALPLALLRGRDCDWLNIRSDASDTTVRLVAARLFGGALPRSVPRRLYVHQGLLQINEDFCLRSTGECGGCAFPDLVGRLSS